MTPPPLVRDPCYPPSAHPLILPPVSPPLLLSCHCPHPSQSHFLQTVILVLQNDLQVPSGQGIVFDSLFSCTILTSASTATQPNGYTISYLGEDAPALTVTGTNNVILLNVSYTTQVQAMPRVQEEGKIALLLHLAIVKIDYLRAHAPALTVVTHNF